MDQTEDLEADCQNYKTPRSGAANDDTKDKKKLLNAGTREPPRPKVDGKQNSI